MCFFLGNKISCLVEERVVVGRGKVRENIFASPEKHTKKPTLQKFQKRRVKKEEFHQWNFCIGERPFLKALFIRTCCWSTINCSWLGRPCSWIIFFSLRNWSHSCSSSFCIRQSSSFFIWNGNKFQWFQWTIHILSLGNNIFKLATKGLGESDEWV